MNTPTRFKPSQRGECCPTAERKARLAGQAGPALIPALAVTVAQADAQVTTAFTYQGQFDSTKPACLRCR
jgi:hypothetical protein